MIKFVCGDLEIEFAPKGCGFPSRVTLLERDGRRTEIISLDQFPLEIELGDGRVAHPLVDENSHILEYDRNGAHHVEFHHLLWVDADGSFIPDFRCSFKHEYWPDGSSFSTGFFLAETNYPPDLQRFELKFGVDLSSSDDVRWHVYQRPRRVDGTLIMTPTSNHFMPKGEEFKMEKGIFPITGFYAMRHPGNSFYTEFFMEGDNTVSGEKEDNCSGVTWRNGNPEINWNFQNRLCKHHRLPWQWRNQWGWVITAAPVKRNHPPMSMYHYLDNYKRFPDTSQVEALAKAGCQVLTMHENWRLDAQNDGVPYDEKRLRDLIEEAHRHHMRVTLYMRGSENSVIEDAAAWFDNYLRRDYDGLYMDSGGAFSQITPPDEHYHNGRMHFRKHYLKLRRLRETVGPKGLLYSHTGPRFTGMGMKLMDGYVSGEGERGIMVKGRLEHAYYSMAAVSNGTMWTAAFPAYSSPRMTPFLAATGQYPHNPIGQQRKSCSLGHPPVPGINDVAFRPLWKIWSCFGGREDLDIYNDYNSIGVFGNTSSETGCYLMITPDRQKALLVLSNFSENPREFNPQVNWKATGFQPQDAYLLLPDMESPGQPAPYQGDPFTVYGYGVAGILFSQDGVPEGFSAPYPPPDEQGQAWISEAKRQLQLRQNPPAWKEVYLRANPSPRCYPSYEESLFRAGADKHLQLGVFDETGEFKPLGWLGRERLLASGAPAPDDKMWFDDVSHVVPLHEYLKPGRYRMGICTWHAGFPEYSNCEVILAPAPDLENGYKLEFYNDIESNRSFITWETIIE